MDSNLELHYATHPEGRRLALHRQVPTHSSGRSVLVVHGATFPTLISAAWRIGGRSWFDELAAAGFEAWGLDFQGYGASDDLPPTSAPGSATDAARQLSVALEFIRSRSTGESLSLVAHSWGTVPAGVVLARSPDAVSRAVFYGPVVASAGGEAKIVKESPDFIDVSCDAQWSAFCAGVPAGVEPPIGRSEFERWSAAYLEAGSRRRAGASAVRVPAGPMRDIEAARGGALPYDPAAIETPILIVRGSWDAVTTEADAIRLFHQLQRSRARQMQWIQGGTHRMHLETARYELFDAVEAFLRKPGR